MAQDTYEVVRVTTPEGREHTFFCEDDDLSFYIDVPSGGYLFVGTESDLNVTDTDAEGFAAAYAPGHWSSVEQILPPEDED